MPAAKVTSKGQITIPKAVRDVLGIGVGDRVQFVVRDDGVVELCTGTRDLMSLAGSLAPRATGVSVADMDEGIAEAASADFERPTR